MCNVLTGLFVGVFVGALGYELLKKTGIAHKTAQGYELLKKTGIVHKTAHKVSEGIQSTKEAFKEGYKSVEPPSQSTN